MFLKILTVNEIVMIFKGKDYTSQNAIRITFSTSCQHSSGEPIFKILVYSGLAIGPHQANLVLIAYASSEGSGELAHPRSLARTSAARSYKQ